LESPATRGDERVTKELREEDSLTRESLLAGTIVALCWYEAAAGIYEIGDVNIHLITNKLQFVLFVVSLMV
jgi:hypothetical protein